MFNQVDPSSQEPMGGGKPASSRGSTAQQWQNPVFHMRLQGTMAPDTSLLPGSSLVTGITMSPNVIPVTAPNINASTGLWPGSSTRPKAHGDPSSSRPFAHVSLLLDWGVLGWDSHTEQLEPFWFAVPCRSFYEKLIAECGQILWSADPGLKDLGTVR